MKVVVCEPYIPAVVHANSNLSECLYRERVDPGRLLEQHSNLVQTLRHLDIAVDDMKQLFVELPGINVQALANITFTRDAVLSTRKGIIVGAFREHVRRFESDVATRYYAESIVGRTTNGCIEGGDFYQINDDVCMIAHGNRTDSIGVHELITTNPSALGASKIAVVSFPENGDMQFIHLDCYFGMAGSQVALLWEGALQYPVCEYVDMGNGSYAPSPLNATNRTQPLKDYLIDMGLHVFIIPTSSQRQYGCNVLSIDDRTVIVQDKYVYDLLKRHTDVVPICVEFGEFHKMYGGIRCATQVCYT